MSLSHHIEDVAREKGLDPEVIRSIVEEARRRGQVQSDEGPPVGYQGGPFAYSTIAARRFFAPEGSVRLIGFNTFQEVVHGVQEGSLVRGVLPVENSIAGTVHDTYNTLLDSDVCIVGEIIQRIEHVLCGRPGTVEQRLTKVLSHPQALAQCARFLQSHAGVHAEAFVDTALAADEVARLNDRRYAAICSREAAAAHGLIVLREGIADVENNFTRFYVIAPKGTLPPEGANKTTLLIATKHEQGALARVLAALAQHGLNLTKLESRPRPELPFEYMFYIDSSGDPSSPGVGKALEEARTHCSVLKVLGSYVAASF